MDISQHNFPLRPLRKDAERNPKRFAIPISFAGDDTMANIFLIGDAPSWQPKVENNGRSPKEPPLVKIGGRIAPGELPSGLAPRCGGTPI